MSSTSSPMPCKTAIVTGACSGIGLGLTRHLLASQTTRWRVVLADINDEAYSQISSSLDPARTMYQRSDVSSWQDNRLLFQKAFEWPSGEHAEAQGRIDLFAANAGILERESFLAPMDLDAEPVKLDMTVMEVGLLSVCYELKLFIYYVRKARAQTRDLASFSPQMVITSSVAGLYQYSAAPQYSAAKHGLVGLTRSVGPPLLASDEITVNAVLPGLVVTEMTRQILTTPRPQEHITPMNTVMRAFDDLMTDEQGKDGQVRRKTGQCVEAANDQLYYREPVEYCNEVMRLLCGDQVNNNAFDPFHPQAAPIAKQTGPDQGGD